MSLIPNYAVSALLNRIKKNAKKKFLLEFPGKLGIFAKKIIRIKRKPHYSESATSKTFIETEFNKMQKKNFSRNFPVNSVFSR